MSAAPSVQLVIPTIGRASLHGLLAALAGGSGPLPERIIVVDDRPATTAPLFADALPAPLAERTTVVRSGGRGPAAARNAGWRATTSEWVSFLDDDVLPPPTWFPELLTDLAAAGEQMAGSAGRILVPIAQGRARTDWERSVGGLETARWATADMAYRRYALETVGGFDERFPRAFREDADLAARVQAAGWQVGYGRRHVQHPVRPADRWVSVRRQAGNADDVLMRAVHGPAWRSVAAVPAGRRGLHLATTSALVVAAAAAIAGRRRTASGAALASGCMTADFARRRIAPGPRDRAEVTSMLLTSVVIPPVATYHWLRGWTRLRAVRALGGPVPRAVLCRPAGLIVDRDGTLIRDVPYNGNPLLVQPLPGVADALAQVRAAGIPIAVVTNQSGVARGLLTRADVDAVNDRVQALLGPFAGFFVCTHRVEDNCACRKPMPELLLKAAAELGVEPQKCVMVGDIGSDVAAAAAAGMDSILVPTEVTLPAEVHAAPHVAPDFTRAVDELLAAPA